MRYSFHGKVRATGQLVDGYVEAETSTEAIDRLADQGIIGVYSVRAEPKQPRNSVLLAGTPEFERNLYEDGEPQRKARRGLPQQPQPPQVYLPTPPVAVPLPPEPASVPVPVAVAAPVAPGVSDPVMLQLVDKLSTLIGQMQKFLDRPAQVVYASGPAREGKGGGGKRAGRSINEAQNSTLKDIFQNNLDLRRSLAKLAETVAPTNGTPDAAPATIEMAAPEAAGAGLPEADAGTSHPPELVAAGGDEEPPPDGGSAVPQEEMIDAEVISSATEPDPEHSPGHAMDDGDMPLRVHDTDHARQAQPAA